MTRAPDAAPAVIRVEGLCKTYGSGPAAVTALEDISFQVPEGGFVSIVGPSGCGKSTLLQILAGLLPASGGAVLVDDIPVRAPLPGKIAVVFQDATLLPWKTAAENIEFPLDVQGIPRTERRERARRMLELVKLADFAGHYPSQLSGGMRQRVAIARGLAQQPRIMLMDEPFGALDEQTRLQMGQELLRIWHETGTTILLITHSLTEALFLSDTVLVMRSRPGRIIEALDVPLARPRDHDMIGSAAFGAARNRIWHRLTGDDTPGGLP